MGLKGPLLGGQFGHCFCSDALLPEGLEKGHRGDEDIELMWQEHERVTVLSGLHLMAHSYLLHSDMLPDHIL